MGTANLKGSVHIDFRFDCIKVKYKKVWLSTTFAAFDCV